MAHSSGDELALTGGIDEMPPTIALILWLVFLLALLRFDPAKEKSTSLALWVPLIWMFIIGSRLPSQWLQGQFEMAAGSLEEGNVVDRSIFSFLILLAIIILVSRSFHLGKFFARNFVLMALVFFALLSVLWSDFPFISLKRWFRDLGNYLVILVVISDPHPLEAVRSLLRRLFYLLIPLSILLIKYFPQKGRLYEFWSGNIMYVGATTSKNMLGVACLVSGTYFFWDTVTRWSGRKDRRIRKIINLNILFIGLTFWLLNLSNSATSRVCLVMGCLIVAAAHLQVFKRNPAFLKVLLPSCFALYLILGYGFDINGVLATGVGRDPTFTGRTNIWKAVLSTKTNPLIGVGYESFWLGPRLFQVWQLAGVVNEAHNGYLEVYLNLGLIGFFLLCVLLIVGYRTICKSLYLQSELPPFGLALWTILLFYNMTESAAFNGQLLWIIFLLVLIAISAQTQVASDTPPETESPSGKPVLGKGAAVRTRQLSPRERAFAGRTVLASWRLSLK